jgi:hypothetical protein
MRGFVRLSPTADCSACDISTVEREGIAFDSPQRALVVGFGDAGNDLCGVVYGGGRAPYRFSSTVAQVLSLNRGTHPDYREM